MLFFVLMAFASVSCKSTKRITASELYLTLPECCPTPDAYAILGDGTLILSCPNYASKEIDGTLVKISKDGSVKELSKVPGTMENTFASPMGIAYAPDGSLIVCANQGPNNGRILKMTFDADELIKTEVIAKGINNPNGVVVKDGKVYVTVPKLPKVKTEKNTSGVLCFSLTDRNVEVQNDKTDKNLIFTTETQNPNRQFGLDGITVGRKGHLLVGDFGDGTIHQLQLSAEGKLLKSDVYASLPDTSGIDGILLDKKGNLYAVGFSQNQLWKIDKHKNINLLLQSEDNDGTNGQLDQPSDLIIYDGKLIISNFDLMVADGMINTKHGKPYTLSYIKL